jgi:TRAP-type C4-dicarboxylate transport system permease small subunit
MGMTVWFERLARAFELVLSYLFVISVVLNFTNALTRYLLGITLNGSDEVSVFILCIMVFAGLFVVTWRRQHLRMDVLLMRFPVPVQIGLGWIELLLTLVLSGFMAWQSYLYAARIFSLGSTSDIAHIPMWIVHAAVPLGFGITVLVCLWRIVSRDVQPAEHPAELE